MGQLFDRRFVARVSQGSDSGEIEKHYGDARVDAVQLDKMMGEFDPSTRNPAGTLSISPNRASIKRTEKPPTLPRVARRAGDRGRTGDVQLGNLFEDKPKHRDPAD
jgi:hypothetical protein